MSAHSSIPAEVRAIPPEVRALMDAMDPAVRAYLAAATSFPPPTEVEHPWYLLRDRLTLEPLYWRPAWGMDFAAEEMWF